MNVGRIEEPAAVDTGAAEEVSEQVAVRMDKMHKLEEKGILPFGHAYKVTHHNKEVHDKVKELEEKGIGRPSTYATIIQTILSRGYVAKEAKKVMPTELGMTTIELLTQYSPI